jgi:outer membrane protein
MTPYTFNFLSRDKTILRDMCISYAKSCFMRMLLIVLFLGPVISQGQDSLRFTKIGYADVDYIYSKLPASKQIDTELKSLQTQLENQLKTKYNQFQEKYRYITEREKSMTPAQLQLAQKELQTLQDDFQKLEQTSQTKFQQRQKDLMQPVTLSIQKAIGEVAKEHQYTFILNAGAGTQDLVLHADDNVDVSDLILEKMGVSLIKGPQSTVNDP